MKEVAFSERKKKIFKQQYFEQGSGSCFGSPVDISP